MTSLLAPRTRLAIAWLVLGVHALAILAMLLVLINGIPPGDLLARRVFVANNALLWAMGWGLWMLATLTLLLFFIAWVDVMPYKTWAWMGIGLALTGAMVDWANETVWMFLAPLWAARAASDSFYANLYGVWDRAYIVLSVGLANLLYTLGGMLLNAIAYRTPNFPRWLARWGAVVWALSLVLSYAAYWGADLWIPLVSAGIFATFLPWMLMLGYGWLRGTGRIADADARARLTPLEVVRSIVPKHPIPMTTVFRECFLVNFAVAPDVMRHLLPGPIEPDLYDGEAYLSVVIAEMEQMRPAFVPKALGVTYNQIVYRAVVRCRGERGVHFLRSDADHWLMSLSGDWLTFFRVHHSRVRFVRDGEQMLFDLYARRGDGADIHAKYDLSRASRTLPPSSKFKSLDEAQKFLVELFAAFAYDPLTEQVSTVRIKRGEWHISVVEDQLGLYAYMQGGKFPVGSARLDSIFYVKELPYYWHTLEKS